MSDSLLQKITEISEYLPQPFILLNQHCNLVYCNSAWNELSSYNTIEENINSWTQIISETDREKLVSLIDKLSLKESYGINISIESKNKSKHWLNGIIKKENDSLYTASFIDNSKEKLKNDTIIESEKRFKNIVEFAPDSIIILNSKSKIIKCNRTFFVQTGLLPIEVYYKSVLDLSILKTYSPLKFIKILQELKNTGDYPPFEIEWEDVNGNQHVSEMHLKLFKFKKRNDFEILAIARDVTPRKIIENSYKNSEKKYRQLFESMTTSIVLFDVVYDSDKKPVDLRYSDINKSYEKLIGISKDEILGRTHTELFKKLEFYWFDKFSKVAQTGKPIITERFVTLFQKYYEVIIYSPQKGQVAAIYNDINEYSLAKIETEKAMKKAKEADKLKSAFLANMSHEIRTPMNGIIGFSKMLKKENLSVEQRNTFIGIIENNCNLLLSLIDDILDLSKIEAGEIKVEPAETNIELILLELHAFYDVFKNEKNKNNLELFLKMEPNLKLKNIVTDKLRLKQVLSNLIGNAIKYTEKGSIEFGVKSHGMNFIEFYVKDTGIGISVDQHSMVFERFWQHEKDNHSKKYYGAGLGLSISKKLVELLGGKIWLTSEINKGSTFNFIIPKTISSQTKFHFDVTDEITDINWEGKVALIVDDDYVSYVLLNEILEETGIKIQYAQNGKLAIEKFKKHKFDIVLMDVQMPELNGIDAVKEMKSINSTTPIIAQTVISSIEGKESCVNAGFDDVISKPIDSELLLKMMKKLIQSR